MFENTVTHSAYSPADFFYELPPEQIAYYPPTQRTASRLLCLGKTTGNIAHKHFNDILDLLDSGDLLVFNDTKVIPARLFARKQTGGKVEILVERIVDKTRLLAQLKASKSLKIGSRISLENGTSFALLGKTENLFELQLTAGNLSVIEVLNAVGRIPLPPYLKRSDESLDRERYQTVFARHPGAIAAPTAGLHFDELLIKQLQDKGVNVAFITLHIGAGTFQAIRTAQIEQHLMHAEYAEVSAAVCEKIRETKQQQKRVIAVGTTAVRSLETAALSGDGIKPFQGETRLFIRPGFTFQCVDALITNFHLPQSTLLMLVCAFSGYQRAMDAYQHAIHQKYRFFSYGDAMWISD
jgi:S-adenosylmethionine:tRNA ribosyltransferase-isomerase